MALLDIPNKINPDISLIHLLDENNCLKDSLRVINDNFTSLKDSLSELDKHGEEWNYIYSVVAQNSAFWVRVSEDIIKYNELWNSARSTVQSLSGYWFKDMSMVWPFIVKHDDWYSGTTEGKSVQSTYIDTNIPNWLASIFPPNQYHPNQRITVSVMLQRVQNWDFEWSQYIFEPCLPGGSLIDYGMTNASFKKTKDNPIPLEPVESTAGENGKDPCAGSYYGVPQYESCTPRCSTLSTGISKGAKTLEDVYTGKDDKNGNPIYKKCHVHFVERYSTNLACRLCPQVFSRGCNHHGGKAGHGGCDNAFSYCTRTSEDLEMAKGCASENAGTLVMQDLWSGIDTTTARILNIPFKRDATKNTWILDTTRQIS